MPRFDLQLCFAGEADYSGRRRATDGVTRRCGKGGDMRSFAVGSIIAAIVMFALGFIFFGLLGSLMFDPLAAGTASSVQSALGGILPATGTYMVPGDEEAFMRGPSAVIQYIAAGELPTMPMAMGMGFVHFLLSALLIGYGLKAVGGDFGRQARVVIWFGLAASAFMHLGDPIWYGVSWRTALFEFVADGAMFIAAGLVLARWFTSRETSRTAAV
jgi:hypothetical protein